MAPRRKLIIIYTSKGDAGAFLVFPHIFNRQGEWIGWVTPTRQVYSVYGHYVGTLTDEPRILRKQSSGYFKPRQQVPEYPGRINLPATMPLSPMLAEIPIGMTDVLEDEPDLMPPIDFGDLKEDLT